MYAIRSYYAFSSNEEDLKEYNTYIVTVPTPINNFNMPDLQPLIGASKMLGRVISKDDIVIYESTTYPGCTEEDCVPVIEKVSGFVITSYSIHYTKLYEVK